MNRLKRHKFRKMSLTSAHVLIIHDAEVNIGCRSPQLGAEVTRAEHRLYGIIYTQMNLVK